MSFNIYINYFSLARERSSVGTEQSVRLWPGEPWHVSKRPSRRTCSFIYTLTAVSSTLTNETCWETVRVNNSCVSALCYGIKDGLFNRLSFYPRKYLRLEKLLYCGNAFGTSWVFYNIFLVLNNMGLDFFSWYLFLYKLKIIYLFFVLRYVWMTGRGCSFSESKIECFANAFLKN